jgi:hypothetical protein
MSYQQPFISLRGIEVRAVKRDRKIKIAYIDALSYFHDGLCEFSSSPSKPIYPHYKHLDAYTELHKNMQTLKAFVSLAFNIEDNTRTMMDLQNELRNNPNDRALIALTDDFIDATINEFIKLRK